MKKISFLTMLFYVLNFNSQLVHASVILKKQISECVSDKGDKLNVFRITNDIYRLQIVSIGGEDVGAKKYFDIDLRKREEQQFQEFIGLNGREFYMDVQSYPRIDWRKGEDVRNSFLNSAFRGHFESGLVPGKSEKNLYAEDYEAVLTTIKTSISDKTNGDLYVVLDIQNMYDYSVCEGKRHPSSKCRSLGLLRGFYKKYYFTNSDVLLYLGSSYDGADKRGNVHCKPVL